MIKAVIDVGSNSVLLLVAELTPNGWRTIVETTAVTSLGEGTKKTRILSESGITATLDALKSAFAAAQCAGAESILAGVTMAGRIATNTSVFLDRAAAQGTPAVVLSGDQEAQLGFLAVAEDQLFTSSRISIVDVGGQSTELVTADRNEQGWTVGFRKSYEVGTLALRDSALNGESPSSMAVLKASAQIDDLIGLIYRPNQAGEVVVLGATGTNLVTIRDRITEWDPSRVHGSTLQYEEISRAVGWMCTLTDQQRGQIPGMEKGREKTLHIGALILERFLNALKVSDCRVSVKGWRYALLNHSLKDFGAVPT